MILPKASLNILIESKSWFFSPYFSELARAELFSLGFSSGICAKKSCRKDLGSFDEMAKHYSIQHRKILLPYYQWYIKQKPNPNVLQEEPIQMKEEEVVAAPAIPRKEENKRLKVKYIGDSGPRIVDTEYVRIQSSLKEKEVGLKNGT